MAAPKATASETVVPTALASSAPTSPTVGPSASCVQMAGSDGEAEGDGDGGFAEVLLEGHVELSRALQDKEERGGAISVSFQAHRRTEEKL